MTPSPWVGIAFIMIPVIFGGVLLLIWHRHHPAPLVRRSTFDAVRRENMTLRDALRDANAELRKHRQVIADIRDGDPRVMDLIMIPAKESAPATTADLDGPTWTREQMERKI